MRKYFLTALAIVFMLAFIAPVQSSAAIADGTYSINYQVNKPGSNSASMANDYFIKPAKLIVKNGKMTMQLTIKNSSWVTQFNPPGGAKVIAEGADQRTVQFSASNANLITVAMKIDIDDIDYHHAYSVDFVFDSSGLPEAKAEEPKQEPKQQAKPAPSAEAPKTSSGSNTSSNTPVVTESKQTDVTQESKGNDSTESEELTDDSEEVDQTEAVENPETSDELPLFAALLFIVAAIVFVRTKQTKTER